MPSSPLKKKYKALLLDIDGTIMPSARYATPSAKVIQAINNASKILHVGLATSRPYKDAAHILKFLTLSGFSIFNGGSQIINTKTKNIAWEQPLVHSDVKMVCGIIQRHVTIPLWLNNGKDDIYFPPGPIPKKIFQIYIAAKLTEEIADKCIKDISHIPTIAAHKVPSWNKGYHDIIISHVLATKQHGIFEIAKLLDIETHEIIGVGDGYNDFPLLMACGLKIAMGNAVDDLKAIADYIAPSVEKDGVVDIIEKFIL